jgi:hypothetical protein
MRFLLKITITLFLFATSLFGSLYAANLGYLNPVVKYIFQLYLEFHGAKSKIDGFMYKDGVLYSDSIDIEVHNIKIKAEKFKATTSFTGTKVDININATGAAITNQENIKILETDFVSNYSLELFNNNSQGSLYLPDVKIAEIADTKGELLSNGIFDLKYTKSNGLSEYSLSLKFGEEAYISLNSKSKKTTSLTVDMVNIPLMLYQTSSKFIADQNTSLKNLLLFIEKYIKSGFIAKGNIELNLPLHLTDITKITEDNLKGSFKINKLDVEYDKNLPQVKNLDTDVIVSGTKISFDVHEGYSSRIKLYDGKIDLDWIDPQNTEISIVAKGKGPASDLTDFIPNSSHIALKKSNIDIREFTGITEIDINVIIPLKQGMVSTYDITAKVPSTGINIFKNQINLTKTSLVGKFDGQSVTINGKGKINRYDSNIKFDYNLNEGHESDYKLDIRTSFAANPNKEKHYKIGFISFLKGTSFIDLSYKNKDKKGMLSVSSDLKNLDLYFDKLGIHKKQGESAKLTLSGEFIDANTGNINLKILGKNNLNIIGQIALKDKITEITLPTIRHNSTNLTAKVIIKDNLFDGNITGKVLDLSKADMIQFLGKEKNQDSIKLKAQIEQVKLKSDVWLTDLKLKFNCDKDKCTSGYIDSKLGNKSLEVLLQAKNDFEEEWVLNCSNAGALLKGIGAYNSMKNGRLTVTLNTSRKEVQPGEIIPIFNGNFSFDSFLIQDAPTLSRLVSLVSLPGFVSMITNNKDIYFTQMGGNFSFSDLILRICRGMASGPYFDFTIRGEVNTENQKIKLLGNVTPSFYGISSIVRSIPLIGKLIIGDKRSHGLISAPFKIEQTY